MSSKRGTPDKAEWLRKAEEAYDRVFGKRDRLGEGSRPTTFNEIEAEAVGEGNALSCWLLESKISSEAQASDCHGHECPCPFCGKPAKRQREDPETREVQARPGNVSFERHQYYCVACRRLFFSGRSQAGPEA
jgi:hypothetical protein